jgi:hypothetical protein
LERPLRFRRAWRLFRFGNMHSPGGASCQERGGFLPPSNHSSPSFTSPVAAVICWSPTLDFIKVTKR